MLFWSNFWSVLYRLWKPYITYYKGKRENFYRVPNLLFYVNQALQKQESYLSGVKLSPFEVVEIHELRFWLGSLIISDISDGTCKPYHIRPTKISNTCPKFELVISLRALLACLKIEHLRLTWKKKKVFRSSGLEKKTHPGGREIFFFLSKITISLFLKIALFVCIL